MSFKLTLLLSIILRLALIAIKASLLDTPIIFSIEVSDIAILPKP